MNLAHALEKGQEINNLDGFIYKLYFYTWSNYVRNSINHWYVEKSVKLYQNGSTFKIKEK